MINFFQTLTRTMEVNRQKPIILIKPERYIGEVNNRKFITYERHYNIERKITKGIILLKHILSIPDYDIIKNLKSDTNIYAYLLEIIEDIEKVFDPVTSGIEVRYKHFTNNSNTMELFIPMRKKNNLYETILNKSYFEWKDEKPLRLLYTDSYELNIDIVENVFLYDRDIPDLNIYGIDPILLIMKYLKFKNIYINGTFNEYLRKEIFGISIMDDIINQWLFNVYISVLEKEKVFSILDKFNENETRNLYIISNYEYNNFKKSYETVLERLNKKQIPSQRVFSTIKFNDDREIKDHLKEIYDTVLYENKLQYTYINFLCLYRYIYLINIIYSYDSTESKRYKVEFNYIYKILKNLKISNRIKNTRLKNYVKIKFENLEKILYT